MLATLTEAFSVVLHNRDFHDLLNNMAHEDWEVDFKGDLSTRPPSFVFSTSSHRCIPSLFQYNHVLCMIHVGIPIHPIVGSKLLSHLEIIK